MNEYAKDFLININNNFKLKEIQIFYCNKILKIGETNSIQERILIISSFGIFLIRKKSFGSIKIVRSISYFDLISIHVAGTIASFSSRNSHIRVKDNNIDNLAFLIYLIRQTQFSTSLLPLSIQFPVEISHGIKPNSMPYIANNIFIDRILSCSLHYNIIIKEEDLNQFFINSKLINKSFIFNEIILKQNFLLPLILALSFEQDLNKIIFQNIKLIEFFYNCNTLFHLNRYIKEIIFDNCDFIDLNFKNIQLINNSQFLKFININNNINNFLNFFDNIGKFIKNIKQLTFENCLFTSNEFFTIFQSIFFNECFHELENLEIISPINFNDTLVLISNFASCSWVMLNKCVKKITLINCNLEIASILPTLFSFDIGLKYINLSNNIFQDLIYFNNNSPINLIYLDISGCKSSINSLLSLFQSIKKKEILLKIIGLNNLNLNSNYLILFLNFISSNDFNFPNLIGFFFDNNQMNSNQTKLFNNFLFKNNNIKYLLLSNSIDIKDSSISLK